MERHARQQTLQTFQTQNFACSSVLSGVHRIQFQITQLKIYSNWNVRHARSSALLSSKFVVHYECNSAQVVFDAAPSLFAPNTRYSVFKWSNMTPFTPNNIFVVL